MCNKQDLIEKLYQTVNIMTCESKIAKNYGEGGTQNV